MNGVWTTTLGPLTVGGDDPRQLQELGDTCTFFGCYEYTDRHINTETLLVESTIYVAKFNLTSCILGWFDILQGTVA